jgi:ribosomal protein S18 acetylase RimI-like enzyme
MSVIVIKPNDLKTRTSGKLSKTIYDNFIELSKFPNLKHTQEEIERILHEDKLIFCVIMHNNKIVAYLLGEVMSINDRRVVAYITYLYTASKFRKNGLASKLIDYVEHFCTKNRLNGIMLICDTEDKKVNDFYQKKGFMLDPNLRRYERYDVLYKSL